jgi:hypothetical protein
MSSNRRYFYGVRVQLRATTDGLPLKFCILPGNCSDLQGLAELALELKDSVQFLSIRATMFTNGKDYLQEINNLKLQVPRKQNSKRSCEPWLEIHKSLMRKYIKTTIGEIARIVSEKDSCD